MPGLASIDGGGIAWPLMALSTESMMIPDGTPVGEQTSQARGLLNELLDQRRVLTHGT